MLNNVPILSAETLFEHFDTTSDCEALFDFDALPEGQQKDDFIAFLIDEIENYPEDFDNQLHDYRDLTFKLLSMLNALYGDGDFADFGYSFTWSFLRDNTGRRPMFAIPTGYSATVEYQELEEEVEFSTTPCTIEGDNYILYYLSDNNGVYYVDRIVSKNDGFSYKIKIKKD